MTSRCRVCGEPSRKIFEALVLHQHKVAYYECEHCRCVQTEQPYWLEQAYASAINAEDTGIMLRNNSFADRVSVLLFALIGPQGKFVDYAGGYGIFTRLMRDRGFDFTWMDKYARNLFARGFEYHPPTKVDALTAFEVFEHFVEPVAELEAMLQLADTIVMSTELMPDVTPAAGQWWYYAHQHGQHICFYRKETLEFLARKFGLMLWSNGHNLHCFSRRMVLPFCVEGRFFGAPLSAIRSGYRAVQRKGRPVKFLGLVSRMVRLGSRQVFWLRKTDDAAGAMRSEVDRYVRSRGYARYVQHLLSARLNHWSRLLAASMPPKTESDMYAVIERTRPNDKS